MTPEERAVRTQEIKERHAFYRSEARRLQLWLERHGEYKATADHGDAVTGAKEGGAWYAVSDSGQGKQQQIY